MNKKHSLKHKIHEIIFEADTTLGKAFDVVLLLAIVLSVIAVMLESISSIKLNYGYWLNTIEWVLTILFTIEYFARIYAVNRPVKYIFSFYGLVDLLSLIPTYLSLLVLGAHSLMVIRMLRLLRVFRIFKLVRFLRQAQQIKSALKSSRPKIIVFLVAVLGIVTIAGTLMYLIEGEENGFTSIPTSIYWTIVTLTTVGYGDIAPQTPLGQFLASAIMIMGYAIIAVPTGIVTAEVIKTGSNKATTQSCPSCLEEGQAEDAIYCKYCGEKMN